jgi:glycosyltransferase involved in cell wall biosynthesis
VLHVITRLELGGAQYNTLYTVAHLDRSEFQPALAWGPGDVLDAEVPHGVDRFEVPDLQRTVRPGRDAAALRSLRGVIRRFRPHLVHTHSSKAGVLGRAAARLEHVPAIHSVHGFGFTPSQPVLLRGLFLSLERLAARWTEVFIAVSHANARSGIELGLFTADRVRVIRSGIPLVRYRSVAGPRPELARSLGVPVTAPLVVQVGNFKPQKAPLDFVRMAARVASRVPSVRFVMVGDGALRPAVEALAHSLGIDNLLVCAGWRDDVDQILAAARVVTLTSRHEGLPRALVEARASGVPVVATAVDGTPEIVADGVTGFLVQPGDIEGLADAVGRLLTDDSVHRRLSLASRQRLEEFDIDRMVRQQEELYRWVLFPNR